MSDPSNVTRSLRERLGDNAEDRLGKALSEFLESPLLTGAIGRMFDAREKASQAQEVAMGALNIPSAADIERLTRRLRAVSHRLEGIEDGLDRLDRALSPSGVEARLSEIEAQLRHLTDRFERMPAPGSPAAAGSRAPAAGARGAPGSAPAARSRAKAPARSKAAANAKATAKAKAAARAKAPARAEPGARPAASDARARPAGGA
jgi:hypothetical protein